MKTTIGLILANLISFCAFFVIMVMIILVYKEFAWLPVGHEAIIADRDASTILEEILLISISLGSAVSGYFSPLVSRLPPIYAGPLSCSVIAFGFLIARLLSGPTHHDAVPEILSVVNCPLALFLAYLGAYVRRSHSSPKIS